MPRFINEWTNTDFEIHIDKILGKSVKVNEIEVAGDGNMNFTYRLKFQNKQSIIVKQSPPFCARFPTIPAPIDRILSEVQYYKFVQENTFLAGYSPEILALDYDNKIGYMADLGVAKDFEYLYAQKQKLNKKTSIKLIKYLVFLHKLNNQEMSKFNNLEMRKLNHRYIFELPFLPGNDAIDLDRVTPGLEAVVQQYKTDDELRKTAFDLGQVYLKKTNILIHGDYYPMSWINTEKGLFIIDPEFAFLGTPEFDLGVFLAHMVMSKNFSDSFKILKEFYGDFDHELAAKFCAVEVLRRVMYVSQLPILNSLSFKSELLSTSAQVLKTGEIKHYENIDLNYS